MASAEAILPEGFRLKSASGTLTISWRGSAHWVFLVTGAFGLVLSAVLLAGFALSSPGASGAPFLFGAGLLFSAYLLLVGLCNRTCISVREGLLQARHGPLPCLLPSIFQVSCTREISVNELEELRVEAESQEVPPDRDLPTYAVHAVAHDGSVETLLTGMEQAEARSVGQVLADSTGLEVSLPEETAPVGAVCRLRRR